MKLEIVTPLELVLSADDVQYIHAAGSEGDFGILENHSPMVATLKDGPLTVTNTGGKVTTYQLERGFLEVSKNTVTVLAEGISS